MGCASEADTRWRGLTRVVLLEDGVLKLDLPADEARAEFEPLFEVGDITHAWGGYGGQVEPLQYERMTDRWFVAVLNSFPEPYGWREIHRPGA